MSLICSSESLSLAGPSQRTSTADALFAEVGGGAVGAGVDGLPEFVGQPLGMTAIRYL